VAYAIFDTPAIHGIPGIKELAQAGSEMVRPLVIAPARLLQVLDDSSVNIALPSIQDELAVTPEADLFTWRPPSRYDTVSPSGSSTSRRPAYRTSGTPLPPRSHRMARRSSSTMAPPRPPATKFSTSPSLRCCADSTTAARIAS
jgi:hypothetical protein